LYFCQRRGYRSIELVPDNVIAHTGRRVAGFADIPVRDEIRRENGSGDLAIVMS
jgi:hypothetical protein